MKSLFLLLSILILPLTGLFAQNIDRIIADIEKNNKTLIALRKSAEAARIGNKTGLSLKNPEFEYNYLWGSPVTIGNRTDVRILQSFDFPTAYGYRNRIAEYRNIQVELEYEKQHLSIVTKARQVCNGIVYLNALQNELGKRAENARKLAESYRSKYDAGEAGLIDYNKSQLFLNNLTSDAESAETDKNALLAELRILNGGIEVDLTDTEYPVQAVGDDFEQWFKQAEEKNPELQWLKQELTISLKNEKLSTAMSLPKLQAGYMSEAIVGQQYQGIAFGLSIPLLESRNAVKYAKAKTAAVQSMEAETEIQFYNDLKSLHTKAISLQNRLKTFQSNLENFNNSDLLIKALGKGEISLIDYLYELSLYYDSYDRLLELKKALNETIIELNRYR